MVLSVSIVVIVMILSASFGLIVGGDMVWIKLDVGRNCDCCAIAKPSGITDNY